MIIIAYEMKNTMYNHPVQFILEFGSIFKSIFTDTVDAYEKITGKSVTFAIVEGDDVCEIVMLQILLIYIKDIVVRTEDDRYVAYTTDFAFGNQAEPSVVQCLSLKNEVGIFKIVRNHVELFFLQIYEMYKKFEIKNKVSNFTDLYGQ